MNNGAALILKGDPTEVDIKKAAGSKSHPLHYFVERGTGNQTIPLKSVIDIAMDIGQMTHCASQFVTTDKGYLVMFVAGGPDPASQQEIEKSLGSIHFVDSSK